jgi:tRNA_anti-like
VALSLQAFWHTNIQGKSKWTGERIKYTLGKPQMETVSFTMEAHMHIHHQRKRAAVFCLAITGIWLVCLGNHNAARADDATKAPDAELTVSVGDIKKDFAADEAAGKAKYLGKIVRISGTMKTVADFDVDSKYAFSLDGTPAINCVASVAGAKGAKAICVRQDATVQGKCITATLDKFELADCQVISAGKDPSTKVSAADLAKAFATKNHSADYEGAVLTIEGTIAKVDVDSYKVFLEGTTTADGKPMNVKCLLGVSGEAAVKKLSKGSKVVIKGTCAGTMDGDNVVIQFAVAQQ